MKKKQISLKKNMIMNIVLTISSFIFPLLTFPYISRILLPMGLGKISFATSLIAYFNMFAQLGIPMYGIRICATVRDDKEKLSQIVQELLIINIIMSVISYVVLFGAIFTVPTLEDEKMLYIILSVTIILSVIGMEWLYKALEQYTYITIRSVIFKFVALILMFGLVHNESDYLLYAGISIFAASASNILNFINLRKYIDFKLFKKYNFKRHLKPIFIFFSMACATTIYTNIDTIMLGVMKGNEAVGYYNAAVKIKVILVSIVTSLGAVILPRASYFIQNNQHNEFKKVSEKAMSFVCLLSIPFSCYFFMYAKEGIFFLCGDSYENAIVPMMIIMPTLFFIGCTNILGLQMLVPMGKENIVLYSEIAGAITDLVFNFLLIPYLSVVGAAIGTLLAEIVVFIIQFFAMKKEGKRVLKNVSWAKICISVVCAIIGSYWIKTLDYGDFIILVISSILFFGIYVCVLLFMKEKLIFEILNQIIKKFYRKESA